MMHAYQNLIGYIKAHPCTTSLIGALSGWAGVWLRDINWWAQFFALLFSAGSFILIADKVWAKLAQWARGINRAAVRLKEKRKL